MWSVCFPGWPWTCDQSLAFAPVQLGLQRHETMCCYTAFGQGQLVMRCLLPSVAADPGLWNDPELRKASASLHEDPFSLPLLPPIHPDHKVTGITNWLSRSLIQWYFCRAENSRSPGGGTMPTAWSGHGLAYLCTNQQGQRDLTTYLRVWFHGQLLDIKLPTHDLSKQCIRVAHVTLQAFWTVLTFHILACSLEEEKSTLSSISSTTQPKQMSSKDPANGQSKGSQPNYSAHLRLSGEWFHQAHFSVFINLVQNCLQSGHISVTSGTPGLYSLISILNLSSLRLLAFSLKSIFWQEHSAKRAIWKILGSCSWTVTDHAL